MRKRLRTVLFGIGLMILLAQPAFAEELGQANITPRTKMAEIRSNPSIVGAGIYTYSLDQDRVLDRMYWDAQPLSRLFQSLDGTGCGGWTELSDPHL